MVELSETQEFLSWVVQYVFLPTVYGFVLFYFLQPILVSIKRWWKNRDIRMCNHERKRNSDTRNFGK